MDSYCLPKSLTSAFIAKAKAGEIDPDKLRDMSSKERREFFSKFLGDDHAKEVNTRFESALMMRNQQKAMLKWVNQVSGLKPQVKLALEDRIQSMDKLLNPATEKEFLADLANKKLGIDVTADEAKQIFQAARKASDAKTVSIADIDNLDKREAYGLAVQDLSELLNSLKGGRPWSSYVIDALNIPRNMQTGIGHLSAMFVQLWGLSGEREWFQGWPRMVQYMASEDAFRKSNAYIIAHPDYKYANKAGLSMPALGDNIVLRDEDIPSSLLEKFNGYVKEQTGGVVPNVFRASGRGFVGVQNAARFDAFVRFRDDMIADGKDMSDSPEGQKNNRDLAQALNDFTGRGQLGKNDKYANLGPLLNLIFYAPRKTLAMVQMFNPLHLLTDVDPAIKVLRMRLLLRATMATGVIVGLARVSGFDCDLDPTSQDFLKIATPWGEKFAIPGVTAYIRLMARLITNRYKTKTGKTLDMSEDHSPVTAPQLVGQYIRSHLSPQASIAADWFYGSDPVGNEFDVGMEARKKLTPIFMNSWINHFYDYPDDAAKFVPVMSSMLGIEVETPFPPIVKAGHTVWGDHITTPLNDPGSSVSWHDPVPTQLDKAANDAGVHLHFPPDKINGVKLNREQYKDYIIYSGQTAKALLAPYVNSPTWGSLPLAQRQMIMDMNIKRARSMTQPKIIMESRGTSNDILQKMEQNYKDHVQSLTNPTNPQVEPTP